MSIHIRQTALLALLPLMLICPSRAQVTPAVIALREHLRQRCQQYPV
ncbi:hypothetical protein [Ferrimonas senticii]|nr:hypothetical protein [Ferrimonas senticii]